MRLSRLHSLDPWLVGWCHWRVSYDEAKDQCGTPSKHALHERWNWLDLCSLYSIGEAIHGSKDIENVRRCLSADHDAGGQCCRHRWSVIRRRKNRGTCPRLPRAPHCKNLPLFVRMVPSASCNYQDIYEPIYTRPPPAAGVLTSYLLSISLNLWVKGVSRRSYRSSSKLNNLSCTLCLLQPDTSCFADTISYVSLRQV